MSIAFTGPQKDQTQVPHLEWGAPSRKWGASFPMKQHLVEVTNGIGSNRSSPISLWAQPVMDEDS